jgi:hypothetical protein
MTSNSISTEEGKTTTASIDDPVVETHHEQKSNEGINKAEEGSNSSPVASVKGNVIREATGESEATGETSIAEKLTVGMETKEQVPKETAKQTSSEKSNKRNKNQLISWHTIKAPNDHDVLLGRGKPVSQLFVVVSSGKNAKFFDHLILQSYVVSCC